MSDPIEDPRHRRDWPTVLLLELRHERRAKLSIADHENRGDPLARFGEAIAVAANKKESQQLATNR